MSDHLVYVGVGSNVEPEQNIPKALERLAAHVSIEAVSCFYRTEPQGRAGQPPFLNGVVRVRTNLDARVLKFEVLRRIESDLGRMRTEDKCADRPIDLDILLFDAAIIDEAGLRVPDPDIRARPFVAASLYELDPGLVLPDSGESLAGLRCLNERESLVPLEEFTESLRERLSV